LENAPGGICVLYVVPQSCPTPPVQPPEDAFLLASLPESMGVFWFS